ncbi:Heat shock protein 60 family co-chaperone GroES [hydrothermal vent metagenome]|uniref:Heat shock protein 60 family co-chaperone GroES n=1 Tax=hydrothermal vent metagenome TaxID=652676 RepID=A0A3B0TJL6_9ZZZZ
MKELQPINQNVLLELSEDKAEQKTASGIIIPDSAKEKQKVAKVVAVSTIEDAEITPGDEVLYKEYAGTEIEFEGKLFLLLPYSEVLSKIVETESI